MTFRKVNDMDALADFIAHAGTQRAAAELVGIDESTISLILAGKRALLPRHAIAIDKATGGLFRAEALKPDTTFIRDADGRVTGWVRVEAA